MVYDITRDCLVAKIETPVMGFRSSDACKEAVRRAIDAFDMEIMKIKQAYFESQEIVK